MLPGASLLQGRSISCILPHISTLLPCKDEWWYIRAARKVSHLTTKPACNEGMLNLKLKLRVWVLILAIPAASLGISNQAEKCTCNVKSRFFHPSLIDLTNFCGAPVKKSLWACIVPVMMVHFCQNILPKDHSVPLSKVFYTYHNNMLEAQIRLLVVCLNSEIPFNICSHQQELTIWLPRRPVAYISNRLFGLKISHIRITSIYNSKVAQMSRRRV